MLSLKITPHLDLIFRINRRHRILTIHNRCDGRFHLDIVDVSVIPSADKESIAKANCNVQIVFAEQDFIRLLRFTPITDKPFGSQQGGFRPVTHIHRTLPILNTVADDIVVRILFAVGNADQENREPL